MIYIDEHSMSTQQLQEKSYYHQKLLWYAWHQSTGCWLCQAHRMIPLNLHNEDRPAACTTQFMSLELHNSSLGPLSPRYGDIIYAKAVFVKRIQPKFP